MPITDPQAEAKGYAESDVGRKRKRHLKSMHCKHKHAHLRTYVTRGNKNAQTSPFCSAQQDTTFILNTDRCSAWC